MGSMCEYIGIIFLVAIACLAFELWIAGAGNFDSFL